MCATHATLTSHPTRNCTEAHASAVCRCSLPGHRMPEIPQTLYRHTHTTAHAAAASATRAVRDLHSRSAYRVFSLTAVWSRPSVSSKQRAAPTHASSIAHHAADSSRALTSTACNSKLNLQRVETQRGLQKGHRRASRRVHFLAHDTPGRRIEVQASVGATLRPTVLVGFRDLRSRSAYRKPNELQPNRTTKGDVRILGHEG